MTGIYHSLIRSSRFLPSDRSFCRRHSWETKANDQRCLYGYAATVVVDRYRPFVHVDAAFDRIRVEIFDLEDG